jgi:hypothetical protein
MLGAQASRLQTHESVRLKPCTREACAPSLPDSLSDLLRFVRLWLTIDGAI